MDTRSKKYSKATKAIAFILACLCVSVALSVLFVEESGNWWFDQSTGYHAVADAFGPAEIENSRFYQNTKNNVFNNLGYIERLEAMRGTEAGRHYEYYNPRDYYNPYVGEEAIEANIQVDLQYLDSLEGVIYCVETSAGKIYTNVPGATVEWVTQFEYHEKMHPLDANAAMAFRGEMISEMQTTLNLFRTRFQIVMAIVATCAVLFLAAMIYLVIVVGRDHKGSAIRLIPVDRLFTEFTLVAMVLDFFASLLLLSAVYNFYYARIVYYAIVTPILAQFAAVEIMFVLSLVRRLKHGTVLQHSLTYVICGGIFKNGKKLFFATKFTRRVVVCVIVLSCGIYISGMIMMFCLMRYLEGLEYLIPILTLVPVPFTVWLAFKAMTHLTGVQEEVLNTEMNRRMRAERLRTELISNVSHDIRTPLTSVITYVDLLQNENIENEKARDYIEVIAAKSQRLKTLTDDLFEASKAASGNIPVTVEDVNLNELITQGLGEMDAKIRDSGLDFRIALGEACSVSADGRLLWRVVENLLSNVFKYAMEGSRVYIDTATDADYATLSVKNISATELNVPAEELMERFRRGDEARGGEGSGLGLNIAKSLTEAMGGRFEIAVDGDLFKATVTLVRI